MNTRVTPHMTTPMDTDHEQHPWEQIGRCVYCATCGERLYQGTIPKGHPVGRYQDKQSKPKQPTLIEQFRERWRLNGDL